MTISPGNGLNLSEGFKQKHRDVPWKKMADMRDVIIHHYFGAAIDIVWRVATKDLPEAVVRLGRWG